MAIDLQQYCDNRPNTGYGAQLMYKEGNESKFHLLIPLETVPTVTGSVETFEYDILTCTSKGQLSGKETLEAGETDIMWHRDNINRLKKLRGRTLNLLKVHADYTAEAFTGTIEFTSSDISGDVDRGTITITPVSIDKDYILDCRDIIQPTAWFTGAVPEKVDVSSTAYALSVGVRPATATVTARYLDNLGNPLGTNPPGYSDLSSVTVGSGIASLSLPHPTTAGKNALVELTVTATGYASWATTVALEG